MIAHGLATLHGEADVCIVGSGPAGVTLALELARLGRRVLMLESGLEGPGEAQALSDASIVEPRRHDPMSAAVARRFGGTSNLWGGRSMPLDPIDFEPRPFAQNARWPITLEDLLPHYEAACRYTTCGDNAFTLPALPAARSDAGFDTHRIERASNQPWFQIAHAAALRDDPRIDIRLGATVVDIVLDENGTAQSVLAAERDGTRRKVSAKTFVLAAGGLESTRLLLTLQRRSPDLFGGDSGPLGRHYMGHVIGEIADIVFADAETEAEFDFLRDGRGSYVRRRFTPSDATILAHDLPNVCFWPVVPPVADPRHGSGPLSAVALALSMPVLGPVLAPQAIRDRHLSGPIAWGPHVLNALRDIPATINFVTSFLHARYLAKERIPGYFLRNRARRYGLSYHAEQSPRATSRVRLTQETDRLGLPRLEIDLRFHRDDAEALLRAHGKLAAFLTKTGLGRIEYRQTPDDCIAAIDAQMAHGTHQIGTARMGATRAEGVVGSNLACFDCPNLYIASSAVFPTSGAANPTLTIVALAARLAQHLHARLAAGDNLSLAHAA